MRKVVRDKILKRDGAYCAICGSTERLEIDHIQPLSKGGRHDEANMQVLCKACNMKKSNNFDWSRYFKFNESPDYILVSTELADAMPKLGSDGLMNLMKWAFSEHARIWGVEEWR